MKRAKSVATLLQHPFTSENVLDWGLTGLTCRQGQKKERGSGV